MFAYFIDTTAHTMQLCLRNGNTVKHPVSHRIHYFDGITRVADSPNMRGGCYFVPRSIAAILLRQGAITIAR